MPSVIYPNKQFIKCHRYLVFHDASPLFMIVVTNVSNHFVAE